MRTPPCRPNRTAHLWAAWQVPTDHSLRLRTQRRSRVHRRRLPGEKRSLRHVAISLFFVDSVRQRVMLPSVPDSRADSRKVVERLREDVLRHIVALKMLSLHPESATLHFRENGPAWALRVAFPTAVSDYDRRTCPSAQYVVLIDGNSTSMMRDLLEDLPRVESILKTGHEVIARQAVELGGGRHLRTFISFTGSARTHHDAVQQRDRGTLTVTDGTMLDPELAKVFGEFGNDLKFLGDAFQRGARWFAIRRDLEVLSACVVYRNFDAVWEIAGVLTQPTLRRQGLARSVVVAALQYLGTKGLQPRYQIEECNLASARLRTRSRARGISPHRAHFSACKSHGRITRTLGR